MYRQLYQMGGIGTLPMDYGQSLQVPQQPQPSFSSAQNITMNPLLNYGQPQLGQAGGTPLTMRSGGRIGYQEGGMGMDQMMPQMQDPMMQDPAMMQEQAMMQPQMQQAPQIDPSQMDPKQALEIIIQMLIAQGIPPEQAREIAIQMVQAVAEGGMGEMSDERVEARFGGRIGYASGGIGNLVEREGYFLGSIGKAISGAVKGVTKAVKSVVKSDIGKIALTAAAIYATGGGFSPQGFSMFGSSAGPGLLGSTGTFDLGSSYLGQGLFGTPGTDALVSGSKGLFGNLGITTGYGADLIPAGIKSLLPSSSTLTTFLGGTALGGLFGGAPKREDFGSDEEHQQAVARYKEQFQTALNNPNPQFAGGLYPNNPFYPQRQVTAMVANGGRIGYAGGGIGDLISQVTKQEYFGTPMMANGGRMQYGLGNLVKGSGIARPVSSSESGGGSSSGFGGMISRLIQQNPQMFKPAQMSSSINDFIDINGDGIDDRQQASYGGRMGYALGAEVPVRKNQAGVKELDYRDTGGFVPPIGIKERADDIPAMLSNNEFVFTADAVRNAGGGDENIGAQRMYKLMKNLESGGRV
jgi:hypothetical protein